MSDLGTWIEENFNPRRDDAAPRKKSAKRGVQRGAKRWFVRLSGCSHETLNSVLDGKPLRSIEAAERMSAATGGAVSVATLMGLARSLRKSA